MRWAHNGIVTTRPYFTKGLIEQIGDLGVALIILVCLPRGRGVALSLVCLAYAFIMPWVAIGAGFHKNYESLTPVRNSPEALTDIDHQVIPWHTPSSSFLSP